MNEEFQRGKQQILYNYLPGKVIDFGNTATFAKIRTVSGDRYEEINKQVLINKIKQQARAWEETFRPGLENRVFEDLNLFAIIDPNGVKADLYPLVFWCENSNCNHLVDFSNQGPPRDNTCPSCKKKSLVQFRFIKAHQCGHLEEIKPPKCSKCHSDKHISVRGLLQFERFRDFQWYCKKCNLEIKFWGGYCPSCDWKKVKNGSKSSPTETQNKERDPRLLDVFIFRASKQFYVHSATLINIPKNEFDLLLSSEHWPIVTAAKYLNLPSIKNQKLKDISNSLGTTDRQQNRINVDDSLELIRKYKAKEITLEEMEDAIKNKASEPSPTIDKYKVELISMSGLDESYWKGAKFSILDSVVPNELGNTTSLRNNIEKERERASINVLGISDIQLLNDFPIITASYGYSRLSYEPDEAYLCSFDTEGDYKGKIPIYVDTVEADALYFQIDYDRVIRWLRKNGMTPDIPNGTNIDTSIKSYFVKLFSSIQVYRTVNDDNKEAKYVLSLLHTLSHLAIRRAEVLCGLERTSISEYIIPATLSFAMYCNHRFGATIGALTSLFDQALLEWLEQIFDKRNCVYDPVCNNKSGNCHACTHLPETSCRHFNLNLGRFYLFGGVDPENGNTVMGYFENTY